jgi:hypothetical protein
MFMAELSHAQMFTTSFWKKRASGPALSFSTAPQSVDEFNCSNAVTIQTKVNGVVTNVGSNLTVNLNSANTVTFYSDSDCTIIIPNIVISAGSSSGTFYFDSADIGLNSIAASAASYLNATQTETITTNPFIWTGGGGNALWATGTNWSGGSAPTLNTHKALLKSCTVNCSPLISSNLDIDTIRMRSDYSGTLTQSAGVTINAKFFVQTGGTFSGGNQAITVANSFNLAGGAFTSTSGTFTLSGIAKATMAAGSIFNHNAGLFQHSINDATSDWNYTNSPVFNNYTVSSGCGGTITLSGSLTVNGMLTFTSGCGMGLNGGTIYAKGNVTTNTDGIQGTASLYINGATNQTITGTGGSFPRLPNTFIASTGGTVFLVGNILPNDWSYVSGNIDAGTSHIQFRDINRLQTFTPGNSVNYYAISWLGSCNSGFQLVGTLNVLGTLEFGGGCPAGVNGGTINAKGNVSVKNQGGSGSVQILVNGSSNQTIDGDAGFTLIPKLEIASTGGVVSITNKIKIFYGFTYTNGTVNAAASSIEIYDGGALNAIIPGSVDFQDVTWTGSCNGGMTLTGRMIIKGTMTMGGPCPAVVNGGTMELYGNVILNNGDGNVQLIFTGPSTTLSGTAAYTPTGDVTIQKSFSRTLTLLSNMRFSGSTQKFISNGLTDIYMNGYNLTLKELKLSTTIYKQGGILTVDGAPIPAGPYDSGNIDP